MESLKGIDKIVAQVGDLPAMPEIVAAVLKLTEDPSTDMARLSALLERDPPLTAKLLRVTNSSYYGMRQYVGTLKLALVILGVRELRNMVLGVSLFDSLRNDRTEALLGRQFWTHSFFVAALAKNLGSHMKLAFHGEDFASGLLHDIGKMVLARQLSDEYDAIYTACLESGTPLYVEERAKLDFTHADAAAALAARWNLPRTLTDAIWLHHPSESTPIAHGEDPALCAVARIANLAAHDDFAGQDSSSSAACAESEAWEVLNQVDVPLAPEARFETLARFVEELKEFSEPPFPL